MNKVRNVIRQRHIEFSDEERDCGELLNMKLLK